MRQNGQVPAGKAAVTGPGRLPCTNVIHAVGPVWVGGKSYPFLIITIYQSFNIVIVYLLLFLYAFLMEK